MTRVVVMCCHDHDADDQDYGTYKHEHSQDDDDGSGNEIDIDTDDGHDKDKANSSNHSNSDCEHCNDNNEKSCYITRIILVLIKTQAVISYTVSVLSTSLDCRIP